jgi:hypothetical protein
MYYTADVLTACQLFNFYLLFMCNIIFAQLCWATSSYFAKYFCDIF